MSCEETKGAMSEEKPPVKFYRADGSEVLVYEGSRLEWDVLAGIAIPGAGTVAGIDRRAPDDLLSGWPPIVLVQVDPSEQLRTFAAEVRAETGASIPTGLDGEGGFIMITGDGFDYGVRGGSIRVLEERRDRETYAEALGKWERERRERLAEETKPHRFDAWEQRLLSSPEFLAGEPVFPGTRLAVRHIGGMLIRGASREEIREDYPYLSDEDVMFAWVFTEMHPTPREA